MLRGHCGNDGAAGDVAEAEAPLGQPRAVNQAAPWLGMRLRPAGAARGEHDCGDMILTDVRNRWVLSGRARCQTLNDELVGQKIAVRIGLCEVADLKPSPAGRQEIRLPA